MIPQIQSLITAAQARGACERGIIELCQCTSIADIRAHSNVLFWIEWASNHNIIPPHFWQAYQHAVGRAQIIYDDTVDPIWDAHEDVMVLTWLSGGPVEMSEWEGHENDFTPREIAYVANIKPMWEICQTAIKSALEAREATIKIAKEKLLDDIQTWIEEQ